jgi:hypothetical protein
VLVAIGAVDQAQAHADEFRSNCKPGRYFYERAPGFQMIRACLESA